MLGLSLWEGRLPGQKTIENEDKAAGHCVGSYLRAGRIRGSGGPGRLGPALGGSDLTFSLVLRQIRLTRLTVHATRPSVRVLVADRQQYREHDMLPVLLQSARGSDKAFEQAMFRKSARLQQRRQAGG